MYRHMFEYLHSGIYQTDFVKVQILERFFKHYSFTTYGGGGGGNAIRGNAILDLQPISWDIPDNDACSR